MRYLPLAICLALMVVACVIFNGALLLIGGIGAAACATYLHEHKIEYSPVVIVARPLTPGQPNVAVARPITPGEPHVASARPLSVEEEVAMTIHRPTGQHGRKPPRNGRFDA